MRLICPNCGAQYEVDGSLIPEAGRDVQCSNCGHGWFQNPEDPDAPLHAETSEASEPVETAETEEAEAPEAVAPDPKRRRSLDPDVADVLRSEAEREAAARRAEAGIESQQELGLDADAPAQREPATARMDRLRRIEDEDNAPSSDSGSRKELLPDVDEINSTLRRDTERREAPRFDDSYDRPRRGGFRFGFYAVLLLCLLALAAYAFAPMLIERFPQTAPYLTGYVAAVNTWRETVNGWIEAGIAAVQDLIGGADADGGDGDT